ncbi:MAG TPA: hypothetical protein VKY33_05995 [Flavobacterium sp.]|nr:hypothetical protein [Flavobacterium sp.]
MIKKIKWFDVFLGLIIALMSTLLVFANKRSDARYIEKVDVKFLSSNNHFITQEMVEKLIVQNFSDDGTMPKGKLDLKNIEDQLNNHPMIAHSEIYVGVDGKLNAEVAQKTAIARVMNAGESYYIDENGEKMPLSEQFSAHVPIVSGQLKEENKERFAELLNKIFYDEFLKTALTGIHINPDQSLIFSVRDFDYKIEFGHLKETDRKLDNYKAFVHYSKNDTMSTHYKNINLRFTEQVVCTK